MVSENRYPLKSFDTTSTYWWLSIRNFVGAEPLSNSTKSTGKVLLDIINVIQKRGPFVFSINHDYFPVSLAFINHTEDSKYFNRTDFLNETSKGAEMKGKRW